MTPTASVIVPTHNRPETLDRALASLAAQEGVEVEAVVVNDAGVDVAPVVARWSGQLEIRLINQSRNQGLSAARNRGLEDATGEYTAWLDDDDVFLSGHLKSMVASLEASGADVAYASCPVSERRIDPATITQEEIDGIPYAFDYPFNPDVLLVTNTLTVHSAVMRSLQGTGAKFDTSLPVQEDWDMWLRLYREYGMQFVHVPQRTVVYHRPRDFASMTTDPAVAGGNKVFHEGHARLMNRWPVPRDSLAATYRPYILEAYNLGASGPVSHFRYERTVKAIYEAMTGKADIADLHDRLVEAVRGNILTER
ncbi:glycosyltransferase family 2 protein [Streptomyces californicus]|uniref:glycosyltransferase family 2 protein n=1 Tax=Streptomyces californicus TaxID=67351 RepID=UPI0037AEFE8D